MYIIFVCMFIYCVMVMSLELALHSIRRREHGKYFIETSYRVHL